MAHFHWQVTSKVHDFQSSHNYLRTHYICLVHARALSTQAPSLFFSIDQDNSDTGITPGMRDPSCLPAGQVMPQFDSVRFLHTIQKVQINRNDMKTNCRKITLEEL
jgi:hypothetical protein